MDYVSTLEGARLHSAVPTSLVKSSQTVSILNRFGCWDMPTAANIRQLRTQVGFFQLEQFMHILGAIFYCNSCSRYCWTCRYEQSQRNSLWVSCCLRGRYVYQNSSAFLTVHYWKLSKDREENYSRIPSPLWFYSLAYCPHVWLYPRITRANKLSNYLHLKFSRTARIFVVLVLIKIPWKRATYNTCRHRWTPKWSNVLSRCSQVAYSDQIVGELQVYQALFKSC